MEAGDETVSNGRVTTAQFYEQQIKTQAQLTEMEKNYHMQLADMERRILSELKPLSMLLPKVERNEEEIKALRNRSNAIDGVNAFFALVLAAVAAFLGKEP